MNPFRRIAAYFGFCQLWRVVLVERDGTRRVLATYWSEEEAEEDVDRRDFDAFFDHEVFGHDIPGKFVAERVK